MTREQARRECEALVAALDLPEPFDLELMCQRVGQQRGKPIMLLPTAMVLGNLCGMWLGTKLRDYVFYEENTSRLHQQHIVCHEIGHILRAHSASKTLNSDVARALTTALNLSEVPRVLGRDIYNDDQEYEAELVATLILRRVSRHRAVDCATAIDSAAEDAVARIARSLTRGERS